MAFLEVEEDLKWGVPYFIVEALAGSAGAKAV